MKFRRVVLLLLLPLVPAAFTGWLHPHRPDWKEAWHPVPSITLAEFRTRPAAPTLWIDAREPGDYAKGHLPGALSLSETSWEASLPAVIDAWTPEQRIIVYCAGGGCYASRATATRLRREIGVAHVFILADGWAALAPLKAAP